jgi:Fe-S cluster assembly ATPase SufC
MGYNSAARGTLAQILAGRDSYEVTQGGPLLRQGLLELPEGAPGVSSPSIQKFPA